MIDLSFLVCEIYFYLNSKAQPSVRIEALTHYWSLLFYSQYTFLYLHNLCIVLHILISVFFSAQFPYAVFV